MRFKNDYEAVEFYKNKPYMVNVVISNFIKKYMPYMKKEGYKLLKTSNDLSLELEDVLQEYSLTLYKVLDYIDLKKINNPDKFMIYGIFDFFIKNKNRQLRRKMKMVSYFEYIENDVESYYEEINFISKDNVEKNIISDDVNTKVNNIVDKKLINIYNYRKAGYTWRDIGREMNISHEYARQLFNKKIVPTLRKVA